MSKTQLVMRNQEGKILSSKGWSADNDNFKVCSSLPLQLDGNVVCLVVGGSNEYSPDHNTEIIDRAESIAKACNAHEALVEALEKLARLGNGEQYGNSDGNMIAREALEKVKA